MERNILLIGASGGLGKHFAEGLAEQGHNIAVHYNGNSTAAETLANVLIKVGVKASAFKADITSEDEVSKLVSDVAKELGSVDVLINNAGLSINSVSWKMDLDSWNKVIAVNLTGPFLCVKHTLPYMRKTGWGRIINISSVVGLMGIPGTIAYASSKAALEGLCKTVAKETAKQNITVNNIALGYFEAGLLYQIPEDLRNQIRETIPKKEFGDPAEIVKCLLYLIGDSSSYITGQTININGGLY